MIGRFCELFGIVFLVVIAIKIVSFMKEFGPTASLKPSLRNEIFIGCDNERAYLSDLVTKPGQR